MIINEKKITGMGRIEFEDDLVAVYKGNKEIYRGIEDYEPMNRENWVYDKLSKSYSLPGGFVKIKLNEDLIENEQFVLNETAGLTLNTFNDSRGIGVVINGKKYVYLTNSSRIKSTFDKMRKYSDGKALSWLKKETNNNYIKVD